MSYMEITEYLTDLVEYGFMYHVRNQELLKGSIPAYRKECPISHCRGSRRVDIAYLEYNDDKDNWDTICIEIKSGYADFYSGHGRNFVGNKNYLWVMEKDIECAKIFCNELYSYVGIVGVYGGIGDGFMDTDNFDWKLIKPAEYRENTDIIDTITYFICHGGKYPYIPNKNNFDCECDKCKTIKDEIELYRKTSEKYMDMILKEIETKYKNVFQYDKAIR